MKKRILNAVLCMIFFLTSFSVAFSASGITTYAGVDKYNISKTGLGTGGIKDSIPKGGGWSLVYYGKI